MIREERKKPKRIRIKQRVIAEVDVNQLAEAIILAEDLRCQRDEENLKAKGDYPSNMLMKLILIIVLGGIALFACLLGLGCLVYGWDTFQSAFKSWELQQVSNGLLILCAGIVLVFVCLLIVMTAIEIYKEPDKHYVATVFSNVVALVALIVSFVALIKG